MVAAAVAYAAGAGISAWTTSVLVGFLAAVVVWTGLILAASR